MPLRISPHTHSSSCAPFQSHCFYLLWNGWSSIAHRWMIQSFPFSNPGPQLCGFLAVDLHLSKLNNTELISPYKVPRFPRHTWFQRPSSTRASGQTTSWRFPVRQLLLCGVFLHFSLDFQRTHTPLSSISKFCFYHDLSFLIFSQALKTTFNPLISLKSPIPGFFSLQLSKIMV